MYKELAVIKDSNKVIGFVLSRDGEAPVEILSIDAVKRFAEQGLIDTLDYRDGKFVPVLHNDSALAKELKKTKIIGRSLLRKQQKSLDTMTFSEFVSLDFVFRKQDIEIMQQYSGVVLANIGGIFKSESKNDTRLELLLTFWTNNSVVYDLLRTSLMQWYNTIPTIRKTKNYGGYFTLSLPLIDTKTDFTLLDWQNSVNLNFIYNLNMLTNMDEKFNYLVSCMPFGLRQLTAVMRPNEKDVEVVTKFATISNKKSQSNLKRLGIQYNF